MDIEIAVDAMELAEHVDQMVLFSGDGDFRPLLEAVQRRGVHATVISTTSSQPPMIADELRRQADVFTDLIELRPLIARELPTRECRLSAPSRYCRGVNTGPTLESVGERANFAISQQPRDFGTGRSRSAR